MSISSEVLCGKLPWPAKKPRIAAEFFFFGTITLLLHTHVWLAIH